MPSKEEKEKRKAIMQQLKIKAKAEFNDSLPISQTNFKALFDYLDGELELNGCNHTNSITLKFLNESDFDNVQEIVDWLEQNGGYCDCEILANVEEKFEQHL
jgi:hypothetical protein